MRLDIIAVVGALTVFMGLGACKDKPTPQPTPSPSPTVEPVPECPTSVTLVASEGVETRKALVRHAQEQVGDVCGGIPEQSLAALAEQVIFDSEVFVGHRVCSFAQGDAIFVQQEDPAKWEEHHAVYYGNGCFLSNTFRGVHEAQ